MGTEGAGARIAWKIQSEKVFRELEGLLGTGTLERLNYELGRDLDRLLQQSYARAKSLDTVDCKDIVSRARVNFSAAEAVSSLRMPDTALLFLQDSVTRGVYKVDLPSLLRRLLNVVDYDGNAICISSFDISKAILVDKDTSTAEALYQIESWSL